ncbi:MAG: DegT/DnrJ/EryC1/StrS family aminotransferase [Lentisphaeria bacterium]|nr:DegT/DnrJ/EryC1/StrS family aminotransferase [Lentisphaeria bacterium]NQZ68790.1 DegT/DnrJ/EryC1/StrS family aminotransferase [Lentisphaeria bacterium]
MLEIGKKESAAASKVIESGNIFRYGANGACAEFEKRYAEFTGAKYVSLTASGTTALTVAMQALGIGPGDEVLVPAHTYMATATAVVATGAIPVIVDIDESIMISPKAIEKAIRKRTKAVIPVHMWGHVCDMKSIMKIARKHKLLVIEDACQCVGGFYEGKAAGTIGDAGCFSFNFFKNMTCGEGGAVIVKKKEHHERLANLIDCCGFFWEGRKSIEAFCAGSTRKSDIEGAILTAQLDRLPGLIKKSRANKKRIIKATAKCGLKQIPLHSLDHECSQMLMFQLETEEQAIKFQTAVSGIRLIQTGRHTFTEWDPILNKIGHIHPLMDPFKMKANEKCRMNYSKDILPKSVDILSRTVAVGTGPKMTADDVKKLIAKIKEAAKSIYS